MVRRIILCLLTAIFSCSGKKQPSVPETARCFADAFFVCADYALAETLTDSMAAVKIRNHIAFQQNRPVDSSLQTDNIRVNLIFYDSLVSDSNASYDFLLFSADRDYRMSSQDHGFVVLARQLRMDWKVTDFGYRNPDRER